MKTRKFRLLVDLSYGSLGFCGLAQESRLFLKSMWELDDVEPTALVFGRGAAVEAHRFARRPGQGRRVENQALFLQALIEGSPSFTGGRLSRWRQRVTDLLPRWRPRRVRTEMMDAGCFWDVVWRGLLSKSLDDRDLDIARECPVLLAALGDRMLRSRTALGAPGVRLDTTTQEFALFHNAQPIRVSPGTCKLVRYYDMIPGLRPDLVGCAEAVRHHFRDVRSCLRDSVFVCISESAREDLLGVFPELTPRCVTIPVVLSDAYAPVDQPRMLPRIVAARQSAVAAKHPPAVVARLLKGDRMPPYVLMASTLEPRKNYVALVRAYEQLTARHRTDLRLIVVGNPGWKFTAASTAMVPLIEQGRLFHLEGVPIAEMRVLYSHAEALVFPSLYEGFGYTPLEAMRCGTPAIVSDVAAHRWVYGDAALYCDPYRVESLVEQMERLLFTEKDALRERLVAQGFRRVRLYSPEAVGAQWHALFTELRQQGVATDVSRARLADLDLAGRAAMGNPEAVWTTATPSYVT